MTGPLAVRELHDLAELDQAARVLSRVWLAPIGQPLVNIEVMRALTYTGNYIAGAYQGTRMVAASVAFLAAPSGQSLHLHSHITGALPGTGAGYALKLHQREWALERNIDTITWTYDPLVRRNAHFNLVKLGALPETYLADFYGSIDDEINAGDETDRALAVWDLTSPRAKAALGRRRPLQAAPPPGAVYALSDNRGRPRRGRDDADCLRVQIPEDIEMMRRCYPGAAKEWRLALRDVLMPLLAGDDYRVTGFYDRSEYLLVRESAHPKPHTPMTIADSRLRRIAVPVSGSRFLRGGAGA